MKSPHRSHHVGWAWLQGWKLCPSPFSSVSWGSWVLLRTLMMPTRLSRSGTFPGLILRALALSRRGGEQGDSVPSVSLICSALSDLRSRSSMSSPKDIVSLRGRLPPLSLTGRETHNNTRWYRLTMIWHLFNILSNVIYLVSHCGLDTSTCQPVVVHVVFPFDIHLSFWMLDLLYLETKCVFKNQIEDYILDCFIIRKINYGNYIQ